MRLFDTHAHLLDRRFDGDRQALIEALPGLGVVGVIECGTSVDSSRKAAALAARAGYIYAAAGIHPHDAAEAPGDYIQQIEAIASRQKVVAIGEIGLDYHYDFSPRDVQKKVLEDQLALAEKLKLPVALHMREATQDMLAILQEHKGLRGVLHCFSGSAETALQCVDMGFCISFTGTVTFDGARKTIEAVQAVPLQSIMAETDCPYLAPEPKRGERNDPANVRYVLEKLALIKGVSFDEMCGINIQNAKGLYAI
ncbi:MAG: TatD family hydrolase [Eubacteriales bacterium]|nr:TatD family hydrolase [Eubacteriales bacterium]